MPSDDGDGDFQRLETAKFSIRSPQARLAKYVQQELLRASERRHRPRKDRCLRAMRAMVANGSRSRFQRRQVVEEAHKYLPQCDELMQNAVDLYIARELKNKNIPIMSLAKIKQYDKIVQQSSYQFFLQPITVQRQYIQAAVLSQSKLATTNSDPFLILLTMHWKHSTAGQPRQKRKTALAADIDIGPFAQNIERTERGEECDPTRLRMISENNCIVEARNLWKRMTPDQKLPFFMQAYLGSHFPASMDRALN